LRRAAKGLLIAMLTMAVVAPLLVTAYAMSLAPRTPGIENLRKAREARPSMVMSADGELLATFKQANREWVDLKSISPHVIAALIATEDRRFYMHGGIDFKRTAAAVLRTASGDTQGGSTITQQLARNLYPEEIGRSATLTRKLKEAITARKIESVYTKDEILETYLNTVPFLYNAYGIEMAARTYFGKTASELGVLESATLVGMLKGTSYYNPVTNPDRALQRRNIVLTQMAKADTLTQGDLERLRKMPMQIDFERQTEEIGEAPHFTQQVRRWLVEWADRNSYNIYADGLVLHTTLDSRLQKMANDALALHADKLQSLVGRDSRLSAGWKAPAKGKPGPQREAVLDFVRESKAYKTAVATGATDEQALAQLQANAAFMQELRDDKNLLQAGFMAMDPGNGHVLAWVGSRDFTVDQFDHVAQARRQPGSTFKPFVYGAAFEDGRTPQDVFVDDAVEIPLGDGTFWRPTDSGGPSGVLMSLRQGLVYSKNVITAQVMQAVGPEHVARLAHSMGVRQSKLDEVPSLALGTSPVTLKEMVSAYSTLANEGRYVEPLLVAKVTDRYGTVLEAFSPPPAETVLSTPVAQTLLDVLRGAIDHGTGTAIRSRFGIRADVAGKTGTTQDNTDGWFILMHPQIVAGAWAGFNDSRVTMANAWGQGAQSALPVVGEFFRQAIKAKLVNPAVKFTAPRLPIVDPAPAIDSTVLPPGEASVQMLPDGAQPIGVPEGNWRPSPVIRYVNVPPPAGTEGRRQEPGAQALIVPRELQRPEARRPPGATQLWTPMRP
jgi:penicillin-binding protein 1A